MWPVCLYPSLSPTLSTVLSARADQKKNIKFAAKESRSILGKGQKPSVLTVTGNLAGNKWGRLSQLCQSENVLLVGVSGEPAISLTENLGMGDPKKG